MHETLHVRLAANVETPGGEKPVEEGFHLHRTTELGGLFETHCIQLSNGSDWLTLTLDGKK